MAFGRRNLVHKAWIDSGVEETFKVVYKLLTPSYVRSFEMMEPVIANIAEKHEGTRSDFQSQCVIIDIHIETIGFQIFDAN